VELALILATAATRIAAAWLAFRLHRRSSEWRFGIVASVLAVTAAFPIIEYADPQHGVLDSWLARLGGGLAVLLTALILVRTLTDLLGALETVQATNDGLEQRVADRTTELQGVNASLKEEVAERKKAESAVRQSEAALRSSEAELRLLAGQLITAREEERRRLARELHDDLTQTLAALALELANIRLRARGSDESVANGLISAEGRVHELADSIHDISRLLHPSILDDLGLEAAIRAECERFSSREGIPVHFEFESTSKLPDDHALTLYRIVQEGLHNIAKHAAASDAAVILRASDGEVAMTIEDSGQGFDPQSVRGRPGLGLVSMGERIRLIEGSLTIESRPGEGATITVRAPVKETVHEQATSLVS
jgi:two-component system NarL family sensor kinase